MEDPPLVVRLARTRVRAHADAAVEALDLDASGTAPWRPAEHADVTLLAVALGAGVSLPWQREHR